ncbi:hypothetical protein J6R97_00955 [bacterium]|nr:hypothetical protein [bacterium]
MVDQINNAGPKVSKFLNNEIKGIMSMEGKKNKIDTEKEYNKIGELLAKGDYSATEKEFLEGYRLEYENAQKAKEAKDFEDKMTPGVKKDVDKLVKEMNKKNNLTPDLQAQKLTIMLNDSKNKLNSADEQYIREALINNGYGNLISQNKGMDATKEKIDASNNSSYNTEATDIKNVEAPKLDEVTESTGTEKHNADEAFSPKTEASESSSNGAISNGVDTNTPAKRTQNTKVSISIKDNGAGIALGDDFAKATIDKKDPKLIRTVCQSITKDNAYSFFKYLDKYLRYDGDLDGRTEFVFTTRIFSVNDPGKLVNTNQAFKAINNLVAQAKEMKLNNTKAYKELATLNRALYNQVNSSPGMIGDLSIDLQVSVDKAIEAMIKEMDKHVIQ